MVKALGSVEQTEDDKQQEREYRDVFNNKRLCPQCGWESLYGIRGSAASTCRNCGFKDPCCGD